MVHRVPLLPYNFYYTEPPPLPVRQPDDPEGPDFVIRAEIKEEHDRGIILDGTTRSGQAVSISIQIVAEGIARILLEGEDSDTKRTRLARDIQPQAFKVARAQSDGSITLTTTSIQVRLELDPFHIAFYGADGRSLLSQNYSEVTNVGMKLRLAIWVQQG